MSAEVIDPDRTLPRRFLLQRNQDIPDFNGAGVVAEGVVWSSGQVTLHWPGQPTVTSLWSSLDDVLAFHRDCGWITVDWLDHKDDCRRECVEYYGGAIWIH